MSSPYELSPRARLDLLEIWERIARDNLDTADRVIANIEATITLISSRPGIGHARPELNPPTYTRSVDPFDCDAVDMQAMHDASGGRMEGGGLSIHVAACEAPIIRPLARPPSKPRHIATEAAKILSPGCESPDGCCGPMILPAVRTETRCPLSNSADSALRPLGWLRGSRT